MRASISVSTARRSSGGTTGCGALAGDMSSTMTWSGSDNFLKTKDDAAGDAADADEFNLGLRTVGDATRFDAGDADGDALAAKAVFEALVTG